MHDMPTPTEWGLNTVERVDVNQADIAPLMVHMLTSPVVPYFQTYYGFFNLVWFVGIWNANI